MRVGDAPISEAKLVIGKDLEAAASEVSLLAGIVDKTKPRVVNEFEGFEGVFSREVLGEIVAVSNTTESVEFGDASNVCG